MHPEITLLDQFDLSDDMFENNSLNTESNEDEEILDEREEILDTEIVSGNLVQNEKDNTSSEEQSKETEQEIIA